MSTDWGELSIKTHLAQSSLSFNEIPGRDNSHNTDLAQDVDKIARQIDAPPNNAKMYWAAKPINALSAPNGWGGYAKN